MKNKKMRQYLQTLPFFLHKMVIFVALEFPACCMQAARRLPSGIQVLP